MKKRRRSPFEKWVRLSKKSGRSKKESCYANVLFLSITWITNALCLAWKQYLSHKQCQLHQSLQTQMAGGGGKHNRWNFASLSLHKYCRPEELTFTGMKEKKGGRYFVKGLGSAVIFSRKETLNFALYRFTQCMLILTMKSKCAEKVFLRNSWTLSSYGNWINLFWWHFLTLAIWKPIVASWLP